MADVILSCVHWRVVTIGSLGDPARIDASLGILFEVYKISNLF